METLRFAGRVTLVTGASGGLGPAVVAAFRAEGARVAAVARRADALAHLGSSTTADQSLLTVVADLRDVQATQQAVQEVLAWGSRIDVLVNAVGGFEGGKPAGDSEAGEWQRMLEANLLAVLNATRAVLPPMVAQRGGRIVNVSSRSASHIGRNAAAYTVAKAGLEALTLAVAEDYREQGITVNAVAPSSIATQAMLAHATAQQRARWVPPESIARVILFLASDDAADVSGAIIPVYGRA